YAADILLWAVLLSAALAVFVRRYRRASVRERSIMAYPLKAVGAGAVVLVAFLVEAALARGLGLPIRLPLAEAMNVVGALVLPLGFLLGLVRERFEQARVADLVRRLPTTPLARLTPALATALGDPDARLVYPAGDGYVDET